MAQGDPWAALTPPSFEALVRRVRHLNWAWHAFDERLGEFAVPDQFRVLKGITQARLLAVSGERAQLVRDDTPDWLIRIHPAVDGYDNAAHITERAARQLGITLPLPDEPPANGPTDTAASSRNDDGAHS